MMKQAKYIGCYNDVILFLVLSLDLPLNLIGPGKVHLATAFGWFLRRLAVARIPV